MIKKNCDSCYSQDRILYKCRYEKKEWQFLCQNCLLEMRARHGDDLEFDQTWKNF